jgi:uncharacterized protein YbjT (DUF2867 family)
LLDAGNTVRVLVRDPDKAKQLFGDVPNVEIVPVQLDDPAAVATGLAESDTAFLAMGSIGIEANLQRVAIQAAASTPELQQLVRLSVLNTGPDSLGINQRAHWSIDLTAQVAGIPYTTIRPAIFSTSLLIAAPEIKTTRTWTGLADTGRVALSDPATSPTSPSASSATPRPGVSTTTSPAHGRSAGPRPCRSSPMSSARP